MDIRKLKIKLFFDKVCNWHKTKLHINSKESLKECLKQLGYTDKEIEEMINQYNLIFK